MYTIYHIPGVKVGCSKRVEARVKEQGYNGYEVLETVEDRVEASKKEIEWQEKLGYGRDILFTYEQTLRAGVFARKPEAKAKLLATRKVSEVYKEGRLRGIEKRKETIKSSLKFKEAANTNAQRKMKPILQYSLDGTLIKEWESAKYASEFFNISRQTIAMCARGLAKTSVGFIWKYKN
jgi:hypothetical protein